MKVRADLHNHLSIFEDIGYCFNRAIDTAFRNLGTNGAFAVVNAQDSGKGRYETLLGLRGYNRTDLGNAFYVQEKRIYVIKGQEVFTRQGHLLVLGLDKGVRLKDYRTLDDSLKEADDHDGIKILVNPFFRDGVLYNLYPNSVCGKIPEELVKLIEKFDGIETYNGETWLSFGLFSANSQAQEFHERIVQGYDIGHDIGSIFSSGGYSIGDIGSCFTNLDQPDFSDPIRLRETLRASIRRHNDNTRDRKKKAIMSTLAHRAKLCLGT